MQGRSRQTEVLFFFDTEDFTANRSADAIADLARICTSEGVIGHFALVGLLARQLVAWKRWDVLEALAGHDIGTHSYGFLSEPMGITESCAVSADGLRKAAQSLDLARFLPPQIRVDGQQLGPADFLFAGLDCLCTSDETITLQPRPQLNSLQGLPRLADFKLRGTWLHSPDLADRYLSQRLRLQAWTLRYG